MASLPEAKLVELMRSYADNYTARQVSLKLKVDLRVIEKLAVRYGIVFWAKEKSP